MADRTSGSPAQDGRPDLLLADLHLSAAEEKASFLNEAFLRFCGGPARAAGRVFLLGDLFERWAGDDLGMRDHPREIAALRALAASGVEILYPVGNRDFMVKSAFAAAAQARALPDEVVLTLADGIPTQHAHGDQYCTDDVGYQRWRRFSRHWLPQWIFLHLSAQRRLRITGGLRDGSTEAKRSKTAGIMDVNAAAIDAAFARSGVRRMIHGHTHRPADHRLDTAGGPCERIVLADWRPERIEWLEVSPAGVFRRLLS